MKLTNPTDDELERAFATEVARWMWRDERGGAWFDKSDDPDPFKWVRIVNEDGGDIGLRGWPNWTHSMDAVMPWLERSPFDVQIIYSNTCMTWLVTLIGRFNSNKKFEGRAEGGDGEQLARAAVIALLRAHGIEVEFTPNQ